MDNAPQGKGINDRLQSARRRLLLGELLSGFLWIVAAAALFWVVATGAESLFRLSALGRSILLALFGLALLVALARFAAVPLLRWMGVLPGLSNDAVARRIGGAFPEVRDRLLNMIQLLDGRHSDAPEPLVLQAADVLGESLKTVPLEQVEDFKRVRKAGRLATLPIAALLAFVLLGRQPFLEASSRLLSPGTEFKAPLSYSMAISPADTSVVKGADVLIRAGFSGFGFPDEVLVEFRYAGEDVTQSEPMTSAPTSTFHLVNLRESLSYRIVAGELISDWYTLEVVDRPVVSRLEVALRYPSYTRIPPRQLAPNEGSLTALKGTRVQMEAVIAGPEVAQSYLEFGSGLRVPLEANGRSWQGSFTISIDDTWRVVAESGAGIANAEPIVYSIRVSEDAPPAITFLAPEPTTVLDDDATVDVAWRITDDYGFSSLALHYRLDESRFGTPSDSFLVMPLEMAGPVELDQTGVLTWRLGGDTDLDPVPGDVFAYFLEVADNNDYSGPSRARTPVYTLRMPSLAERYEELDGLQDQTETGLESVAEEANRVREQFEELRDELRSKTEAEWQDEQALQQLMEEQQSLEESVDRMAEQIQEMTEEMSDNNLVSEETLEMFEELREVAEEINTPEMMEALQKLQQAMQEMNMQEMQEALENFEFSEQMYQQRMERTLELFKNLRVQQDLEEAARRAEDLAKTEEKLAEQTAPLAEQDTPEQELSEDELQERAEALASEQERAAEEMEDLQEKLDEIAERMEELDRAPDQVMDELADDTRREDMPSEMRENAEQMRQQDFQKAQQQQQQMSQQLQQLQQSLEQMQQGMQGAQMQMNMAGLRRALDDVLGLSNDQETLRAEVLRLAVDSPRLRETAQQQLRISEGAALVADSLQSLARSIPQMSRDVQIHAGESLREMADATQAMTDRAARRAAGYQKGAMTHLNELALMLADLLDQMMNGQGSGGNMSMEQFMEQMQNMSGQQQQLNQQVQQLLNDMQGNRLTQDMQERVRQLAGQQEQIRRDLRQLSRDRNARNNALGDLEQIAEQMAETIEELQQQRISRRTVQRQQQILTRLLEASRSMQERGRERKRESRTADQFRRASPGELTPSEQADQLRRDLIRALESGYAPDYESLIRRYFELLGKQEGTPENGN